MKNMKFRYFSEAQVDQYNFFRVPKALFKEECFKALSFEAKILYSLMLDRVGLSIKNQWLDSQGRTYIIFTVADVMDILGCQSQKAVKLMKELDAADGIGLIEKKRVGLGRPNIIYVKNFMTREDGCRDNTDAAGNDFQGNGSSAFCKGGTDGAADARESLCGGQDADIPRHTERADTAMLDMNKTDGAEALMGNGACEIPEMAEVAEDDTVQDQETGWWMSGEIPEMAGVAEDNAIQDQETDWWMSGEIPEMAEVAEDNAGRDQETDWWMSGEIPEMAEMAEDNAGQDEMDWWMQETYGADVACENQKSVVQGFSGIGGSGAECGKQRCMMPGTAYVDSVDNVDKCQKESWNGGENQILDRMDVCFMGGMSGAERESAAGPELAGAAAAGWMPASASVWKNSGMPGAEERNVCEAAKHDFQNQEEEAMWCSGFERKSDGKCGSGAELQGCAGQEFQEREFLCGEMRGSGFVFGETVGFWKAECNDTDTSENEYISETENNENKNSSTDFCNVNQSYQTYQSNQSYQSYQSGPSPQTGQPGWKKDCARDREMETGGQETKSVERVLPEGLENNSENDRMDAYREVIRDNISYGCFQNRAGVDDVDELVELMVETMMVPNGHTIRVAGMDRPASVVKGRFMKLAYSHIEYVMSCLQKHTGKIWNIKAYLLTALYNSTLTISSYYRAEVNHDLYGVC